MDDRKPSVKCPCGHSFDIPPAQLFQDVACPQCGKVILASNAAPTAPKSDSQKKLKSETLKPVKDPLKSTRSEASGPAPAKNDPPTQRKAPLFMKDGPLPAPIPGYTFLKRLGQGGMGEVFLAKQESLDRHVAIKLLPPDLSKDKAYVQSFMKEARSAGKVTHENIMGSIDVGESNGRYFFVMEYVQGETLFRLIKQQKTIPEAKALEIARQVARGLRHAFQMGLIHRDIKPQNILITPEGQAKVCDFGLATELKSDDAVHGEDEENVHTTPAYASPEQCRAESLDHRTDMYSLGVTLYEMLAGRRPFIASTPKELMTKQVTEQPQPPKAINPAISEAANQLVLRMLKKHKDERPKTYDELLSAFEAVTKTPTPKTVRGPSGGDGLLPRKIPLPALIGAAAAALLLVVGIVVFATRKPAVVEIPASTATLDPEVQRTVDDMKAIERNSRGKPGEYATVRAKWKALEDKYASTPHRAIFAGGRVDFETAVNAEADAAAKEAIDEATRSLDLNQPADAIAALRRFPGEFSGTPAGNRVAAKMVEIERAANDKFFDALQAVNGLVSAGKFEEARHRLLNLKASAALDSGGELRPQRKAQIEELLKRIDTAIAEAKNKPLDPVVKDQPSVKPADVKPSLPEKSPEVKATPAKGPENSVLPAAAAAHYAVLRDPAERSASDKRLAAAGFFSQGASKSAFHHAAAIFLARDEAAWKLEGPALAGLQEYLASPELNHAEPGRRSEGLTPERHQKLLELLIQKIAESSAGSVDALQLFACAHLQEISAKKGKLDPALLIQGKFAKGPIADLWGPASSVIRIEIAGLLLKPPGLWVPRATETAMIAGDFPTRYLGVLCTIKDQTFDAAPAMERWKKLGPTGPDPAAWTKFGDAVADRIKQETTCELCLGQGRYACSACAGTGAQFCATCRGVGKVIDPSEGTNLTCKSCSGRRMVACTVCLGARGSKCGDCDGKKTRPLLMGTHYRMFLDLGLCDVCAGTGNMFTAVAYPCHSCDGAGRSMDGVIKEFAKLPAWALKGREGRMLHATLRWLARHQSPNGSWSTSSWNTHCPETGCKETRAGVFDHGLTSLALVAFLNAGIGPDSTVRFGNVPLGPVVRKAMGWIVSQQQAEGVITNTESVKPVLENALAAWALFTAVQLAPVGETYTEKDRTAMREVALRSLKWAMNAQTRGAGWGYTVGANSDTWVTSWNAMALLAAKEVGVEIPKLNQGYILQWLDAVTDKKDFHLGYMPAQMGKVNLAGNEAFHHHDTLSALGSLVRLQLEGKPSATYAAADKLLERDLPNSDPMRRDYCYWYFGTLFMAYHEQRRGALWTLWTQSYLREALTLGLRRGDERPHPLPPPQPAPRPSRKEVGFPVTRRGFANQHSAWNRGRSPAAPFPSFACSGSGASPSGRPPGTPTSPPSRPSESSTCGRTGSGAARGTTTATSRSSTPPSSRASTTATWSWRTTPAPSGPSSRSSSATRTSSRGSRGASGGSATVCGG
jgi:predicted Ser/Thr protein kinase